MMIKFLLVGVAAAALVADTVTAADCGTEINNYNACMSKKTAEIGTTLSGGPDGKPDWMARGVCNMLEGLTGCFDALSGSCKDGIQAVWKSQSEQMMEMLSKQVPNWDGNKCPAAQRIMNGAGSLAFGSLSLLAVVVAQLLRN